MGFEEAGLKFLTDLAPLSEEDLKDPQILRVREAKLDRQLLQRYEDQQIVRKFARIDPRQWDAA